MDCLAGIVLVLQSKIPVNRVYKLKTIQFISFSDTAFNPIIYRFLKI